MIIIRKKNLLLIGSLLCISLTAISLKTAFTKPKTVPTVNLPVSNKVIVLDAGHGVPDERSPKLKRHNRSRNKPKNCTKSSITTRTKWSNSYSNKI